MNGIRFERVIEGETIVLRISGKISVEDIPQLQSEIDGGCPVLDLTDVRLVSGEVIRFLRICESRAVRLQNCPQYIREWISNSSDDAYDLKS